MELRIQYDHYLTDLPEKQDRKATIVLINNMPIASITIIMVDEKAYNYVKDFFPSSFGENPCYSGIEDKNVIDVVNAVKERFEYFLSEIN